MMSLLESKAVTDAGMQIDVKLRHLNALTVKNT